MLEFHPVSKIFPLMQGEQYDKLVQDIRENGLLEPIWLHEGQIIDGRNRYRACLEAGVELDTREWNGEGSLIQFIVSLNLRRRHLTSSQRAAAAAEALDQLKAEAKERQQEGGKTKVRQRIDEAPDAGKATEQAAKMFGTNRTYVAEAAKIKDENQSTFKAIMKGDLTLSESNLIREYIHLSTHVDRVAALGLDAQDRVTLARIAKQADASGAFGFAGASGLKRALDLFEDDDETTIKQAAKQIRLEIKDHETAQKQRREEQERQFAEDEERAWKEREPFEYFAEFLLGNSPGLNLWDSAKEYDRVIRHMKRCKLTKIVKAIEKMKAEWDAEHEQERA